MCVLVLNVHVIVLNMHVLHVCTCVERACDCVEHACDCLVLQGVSGEVVLGYIDLMAGERDPRNLQLNFSSVTLILHHLQYGGFIPSLHSHSPFHVSILPV